MVESRAVEQCIFCRIVRGELGTELVAENEQAIAFRDLNPQAPSHVLIVPRRHLSAFRDLGPTDTALVMGMLLLARRVAELEGLLQGGYRLLTNDGLDAGQSVPHLHFHVLGGRKLGVTLA